MTGDGVNDAPALKKADVGIAVEGATDAACAAADIVLTEPGLATIIVAIKLSRCIFQRLKNYLTYRVASSLTLALFFLVSASAFNPQAYLGCVPTNGALPAHVAGEVCQLERVGDDAQMVVDMRGVAIPNFFLLSILQLVFIVIFNDLCMITVAWDNVRPSRSPKRSGPASARTLALPPAPHPNPHPHTHASPSPNPNPDPTLDPTRWDLPRLYSLSGAMCLVVTTAQLLFLGIGFSAMRPAAQQPARLNLFWYLGLRAPLQYSEMATMVYVSLSWAGRLTFLSAQASPSPSPFTPNP